jgi:hypothetical protein
VRTGPRKLKSGCYAAQLVLGPDVIAFARTQWRQQGYLDVEDYFAGILNTAMLEEMDQAGRIPARRAEDLDKL